MGENATMPTNWDDWGSEYEYDYSSSNWDYDDDNSNSDYSSDSEYAYSAAQVADPNSDNNAAGTTDDDEYSDYDYWNNDEWNEMAYDEDFAFSSDILGMASELNRAERMKLGHSLTTMLIGCTFRGKECTPK